MIRFCQELFLEFLVANGQFLVDFMLSLTFLGPVLTEIDFFLVVTTWAGLFERKITANLQLKVNQSFHFACQKWF